MSRTAKSIQNSKVALLYSALVFITGFFSRKIFLEHLGAELLGLNTTAVNLLQFLNLAEMGIGAAVACTLYKPLFEREQESINEIISLQGWLYRNIAFVVIACSGVLMTLFPMIFAKSTLPLGYAYATFSVLLFGSLLDYFVNYKQIILSANQEQYKILYSYNLVKTLRVVFQIIALSYFENGYIWWLAIEFASTIIASIALRITIRRAAPNLQASASRGAELRHKYPEVITKVKQIFVHKIGSFVLSQSQPLIIYAYATLTAVAYYGNYMFIILGATQLTTSLFNGMAASVGNLIAEGDERRIMSIFDELFTTRFLFVSILSLCTYIMIPQFITLWIGAEYIMPQSTTILLLATFFIRAIRSTVDEYLNAFGLFHDTWSPIVEATINIGCSVALGYLYGMDGVLWGAIISLVLIIMCWKPYFLFRSGLKQPISRYIKIFGRDLAVLGVVVVGIYFVDLDALLTVVESPILNLFISGSIVFAAISITMTALLYPISQGIRDFAQRAIAICMKR